MANNSEKLILPKPHISWSQMSCWESNPERFRKEYFECGDKLNTKYLRFGHGIHEMIENGTYKELLPDLIVYDKNEFEVRVEVKGIPTLSFIDSYNSEENIFRDTKTGKIPWTKAKVIKHGQLIFYATVLKHLTGKTPDRCYLDWIESKETREEAVDFWRGGTDKLNLTGKIVTFEREFFESEIEKMEDRIVKNAWEISRAYQRFIEEI